MAQLGEHAAAVQPARHLGGALPARALEIERLDLVVGDEVHQRVLALEQALDAFELVVAVVDAFEQRPLVLDGVAGGARVALTRFHEFFGRHGRGARQQLTAQPGLARVQ